MPEALLHDLRVLFMLQQRGGVGVLEAVTGTAMAIRSGPGPTWAPKW